MAARRLLFAICSYMTPPRSPGAGGTGRRVGSHSREVDLRDDAVGLERLEEGHWREPEIAGQEVAREGLEGDVVVPGAGVVVAAGVLDLVLAGGQLLLELQERLDRPQLWVVL